MSLPKRVRSAWQYLFGNSASAFGTLSGVLLILLAVVPAKDISGNGSDIRNNICD